MKDAACRIIRNVSRHPKNRTLIYRTELSLKADEFYDDILAALKEADKSIGSAGTAGSCSQRACWDVIVVLLVNLCLLSSLVSCPSSSLTLPCFWRMASCCVTDSAYPRSSRAVTHQPQQQCQYVTGIAAQVACTRAASSRPESGL